MDKAEARLHGRILPGTVVMTFSDLRTSFYLSYMIVLVLIAYK